MADKLTRTLTQLEDNLDSLSTLGVRGRDQGPEARFAVDADTNKQWRFRAALVGKLQAWVFANMSLNPPVYRNHNKKRTPEEKFAKAGQYVIEHLAMGKMIHPLEQEDPLFTRQFYEDASMARQLANGRYQAFRNKVLEQMDSIRGFDTDSVGVVTWEEVAGSLGAESHRRLQELQDELSAKRGEAPAPLGEAGGGVMDSLIGLVLRYQCLMAFDSNFHGSVPGNWKSTLGGFTECFASPFNHKFERYYSMFEQDREFGSLGNFFVMLEGNRGVLPNGNYEINPPWMDGMYERLAKVLERTLETQDVKVVLVAPNWDKTRWLPSLQRLVRGAPRYRHNSCEVVKDIGYVQDLSTKRFRFTTVTWIFSLAPIPEFVLQGLGLA